MNGDIGSSSSPSLGPYMMGVPRHVWREGIFHKIGDYLGNTMEVDYQTTSQENLQFARVKILLNGLKRLLAKLSL